MPGFGVSGVIARTGSITTVKDRGAMTAGKLEPSLGLKLVTCTVKVNVPTAVSVPDRVPPADRVVPDGGVPEVSANV